MKLAKHIWQIAKSLKKSEWTMYCHRHLFLRILIFFKKNFIIIARNRQFLLTANPLVFFALRETSERFHNTVPWRMMRNFSLRNNKSENINIKLSKKKKISDVVDHVRMILNARIIYAVDLKEKFVQDCSIPKTVMNWNQNKTLLSDTKILRN